MNQFYIDPKKIIKKPNNKNSCVPCSFFNRTVLQIIRGARRSLVVISYQIRASVAEGSPVLRKISLTSGPDTSPSMSPSVLLNTSSYLALSAGDTTHYTGNKTDFKSVAPQ